MANPIRINIPGLDEIDGDPIGVQVTNVAQNDRTGVPVYVVNIGVLPGDVDNPRALFGHALRLAYTNVLQRTNQQPNPDDMVQFYFEHQNLTHGDFCSENFQISCTFLKKLAVITILQLPTSTSDVC
jgi:hypothetical protein